MKIAIASGKGGTGKTSLAAALTEVIPGTVQLLDCDVEEPNCHLFFNIVEETITPVERYVPFVHEDLCVGCGTCSALCQFNAIISLGGTKALVFPELCHSCGGCKLICPERAIETRTDAIGEIRKTPISRQKTLISGTLAVGQPLAPPVIKQVLKQPGLDCGLTIIDAPPGTSCSFVTAVRNADFIIFVTEATPFGLHDLGIAIDTIRELNVPFGVVANRIDHAENAVSKYCRQNNIMLLTQIRDSRRIAEFYSKGITCEKAEPYLKQDLLAVIEKIRVILKTGNSYERSYHHQR